ncbi:MAG: hypothetical protein Q8L88_02380 [Bacteroidota bacterium]|nr:hypothetical protein [Bacteroidota bacterium]
MKYPTLEQVAVADRLQTCRWYRFLSSPTNGEEENILNAVIVRFNQFGGMTPEISKQIGWGK